MDDDEGLFPFESMERVYKEVSLEDINQDRYKSTTHAAHVMIYAPMETCKAPPKRSMKYCVLMQFRFDGCLGFSGGLVDPGETPEEAVVRETEEEMGVPPEKFQVVKDDLVVINYSEEKDLLLHFYSKKVTMEQIESMEQSAIKCKEYGDELLGFLRVPLYTMSDGFRGFPAFLTNRFVGNAKQQLILGLLKGGIMTQEEIDKALAAKPKLLKRKKDN